VVYFYSGQWWSFAPALTVALGAAEDEDATNIYQEAGLMGGISASGFRFGSV